VTLRDAQRPPGQVDVLQLGADRLRDARAGREARFADEQIRIDQAREHLGRLVVVQDAVLAHLPVAADVNPLHRVGEGPWDDAPFLGAGDDAAHNVPQVGHHAPGRAFLLQPIEDRLGVFEIH